MASITRLEFTIPARARFSTSPSFVRELQRHAIFESSSAKTSSVREKTSNIKSAAPISRQQTVNAISKTQEQDIYPKEVPLSTKISCCCCRWVLIFVRFTFFSAEKWSQLEHQAKNLHFRKKPDYICGSHKFRKTFRGIIDREERSKVQLRKTKKKTKEKKKKIRYHDN
jgi:hypothetical protein